MEWSPMFSTVFDMFFRMILSCIICFSSPTVSQTLLASDIPEMNESWNDCNQNMHLQEQFQLLKSLQTHVATDTLFWVSYEMTLHDLLLWCMMPDEFLCNAKDFDCFSCFMTLVLGSIVCSDSKSAAIWFLGSCCIYHTINCNIRCCTRWKWIPNPLSGKYINYIKAVTPAICSTVNIWHVCFP